MSNSMEQVISFEVNDDDIILFSNNGVSGIYPARLFLCEIYESLSDCFERDIPCDEFFNYVDPRGAWELLSDFFDKTDYLQYATLKDFEEYRARYNISLDYKKGEMSTIYEKERSVSSLAALKRYSKELDKWRIFDKATADNAEYIPNIFRYYSCNTMIDFVFAMVHYLIYNDYRITRCAHCGKLFATKKGKKNGGELYCSRNSPYSGYEDKTCKAAVKAIKDKFDKKREAEYERLRQRANEYGTMSKHCKVYNDFCRTCDDYREKIKKGASIELLKEYEKFLFYSEDVRPKYVHIKDW